MADEVVECPECGEDVTEENGSPDGTRCINCYWKGVEEDQRSVTGRLASNEPNRPDNDLSEPGSKMFEYPVDGVFVHPDYAQIEFRIYAAMAAAAGIPEEYLRPPKQVEPTVTEEDAEMKIRTFWGIDHGIGDSYSVMVQGNRYLAPQADDEPFPPDP